ncbi:hypothetical protein TELCIR_15973, partial [Teladorsagia circumcincta]
MCDDNEGLMIVEESEIGRTDEDAEDDDVVILDECGEGDEFLEPPATKAPAETAECKKPSEQEIKSFPGRKKKDRRVFRRKGRKRFEEKQKQQEAERSKEEAVPAAKILPAESSAETKNKKKPPAKAAEQVGKKSTEEQKLPNKKRTAEPTAPSSTPESGTTAKQPRLDEKNSAQSKAKKTFPKKTGSTPQKKDPPNGPKAPAKGSFSKSSSRSGSSRNQMSRRLSSPHPRSGPSPFVFPLAGRREWQSGPAPFQNQRYPQGNMYGEQMRYGEPYPFSDRRGVSEVSPWSRPPAAQSDEMYKLESVMRRAAQENTSSLEAVRQVEKMGLGSVVGAILNAVEHRFGQSYSAFASQAFGGRMDYG